MRAEDLFAAIGAAAEEADLERSEKRKFGPALRLRVGSAAACLLLAVGLISALGQPGLFRMGAASSAPMDAAEAPGAAAPAESEPLSPESTPYMSYAGPVLPLTAAEAQPGLSIDRNVVLDFAPFGEGDGAAAVSDSYLLTNHTQADISFTALYPISGSLYEHHSFGAALKLDGENAEYELLAGPYLGGFRGAGGDSVSLNLAQPDSWEDYAQARDAGELYGYDSQLLRDEAVKVYIIRDESAPADAPRAATLALSYTPESDAVQVLSCNFNGSGSIGDRHCKSFFIREDQYLRMLIVRGGDIGDISLQGYRNGACQPGEELNGVSARVEALEMSLYEALEMAAQDYYESAIHKMFDTPVEYPFALYRDAFIDAFLRYSEGIERYREGRLDDLLSDCVSYDRIFYLSLPVCVPAGGSISLEASYNKAASFNFLCGADLPDSKGFQVVGSAGSALSFGQKSLELQSTDTVEILSANTDMDSDCCFIELQSRQ